ncbi:MAG: hypothetical protein ACE5IC_04295 [Candidatus Brocadiales bacterium]
MIVEQIKNQVYPGTVIPKPEAKANFVVKGWGKRRGENALIYKIPNHKNPNRPYQKGITESEFRQAHRQIINNGNFTREWFDQNLQPCAEEGGCNFTTIGGIFELLGIAYYERGVYCRLGTLEGACP